MKLTKKFFCPVNNGEPVKAPSSDFIRGTLRKIHECWDEEVSFPPDFDEMGSNGLRG